VSLIKADDVVRFRIHQIILPKRESNDAFLISYPRWLRGNGANALRTGFTTMRWLIRCLPIRKIYRPIDRLNRDFASADGA
jgi:hypothetical protein